MTAPIVCINDLIKQFKPNTPPAIEKLSLSISAGKLVAIAGPDGSGKTTLIRLMAGLLEPTSGTISICGYDTVKQQPLAHRHISYMPQRFGLYEDLTVQQNLDLYADLHLLPQETKKERFHTLLSFTGLSDFTQRLASNLSGGMKQKLGLACAMLRKPQLLLLDEPTVGVDPISRRELWRMIFDLVEDSVTVVCSTSYLDEAERCDEVLLLLRGKLLYNAPPKTLTKRCQGKTFLIHNPAIEKRASLELLLSDPAIIDGTIQADAIRITTNSEKRPELTTYGYDASHIKTTPAKFEDAFIDLLGGGPKKSSSLTSILQPIQRQNEAVVVADALSKKFGSFTAVDNVSFQVSQGEILGLLGPNGAGKSTTFKMLCGLLTPTTGNASIAGYSLQDAPHTARSLIGYMAQKFSLYDNMSVSQNLQFFHGIYNNTNTSIIQVMVDMFALTPFLKEPAGSLPFGFKQRLALACALMHNPKVLFLDEPTSGVDPITRREFWNHIHGMCAHGVAVIVTTHFMEEAEYCDRIGLINQGKLIQIGTPEELKQSIRCPFLPHPTIEDAFITLSMRTQGGL